MSLKCKCGNDVELTIGFDGCDWESVAGEGSGFGHVVYYVCKKCGLIYEVCRFKEWGDISEIAPRGTKHSLKIKEENNGKI